MASLAACSTAKAFAEFPAPFSFSARRFSNEVYLPCNRRSSAAMRICGALSVSAAPAPAKPDDLVDRLVSMVVQTDRGVLLSKDEHQKVAEVANELQSFCVAEPVKCPLIFGEWDVLYCSNPTSPGGEYRSALGRVFFKTKDMKQVVEAPDTVNNCVTFSLMGFVDGEVSLKGKLRALDEEWIQVVFEPPELKVGGLEFTYGGQSEVKLRITYIDEKIRLGLGSRGSLFVFQRRKPSI
ncbi:probable plastid-lipid-associated protein 8, chloroplastic [Andrographis paniculata]|uniref:probable plastid-lipid-associated protein 8, chloroplastic n=1 Tax=Andrographis paniculata TaxID=175694 RepID=UPI0021E8AAC6|nr:probable plastid-lipid-associated protein 8, chloroplastic [Andrographis paniculata]